MHLSVVFGPRDPESLRHLADEASDPASASYGRYLDRHTLARSFGDGGSLDRFLVECGMKRCDARFAPWVHTWSTDRAALVTAFGRGCAHELMTRRSVRSGSTLRALSRFAETLRAIELSSDAPTPVPFAIPARAPVPANEPRTGLSPEMNRRRYAFDEALRGEGETIAVMALGGVPDRNDLERFWARHGISSASVAAVSVGPLGACADDPFCRLETTMNVQWIGALAPGARIVVYLIDPSLVADPWSAFLVAVLADRKNAPTVAVTSWSAPERQYHRVHGREIFAELLDQASAIGVTVIAASGDWGVYDGMPKARDGGLRVCDSPGARATFPGSEPRVLSVGGTHVRATSPWCEHAWSAPIPETLRRATGLDGLAGSGGFSASVPVPRFQQSLRDEYPRSSGEVAKVTGRAQPDVSFAAWGLDEDARPTGYRCLVDGVFRDDGGGTSVAAPLWAALIARLNEARRSVGGPRLGACGPWLYRVAEERRSAFRAITEGTTDIVLPVAADDGRWILERVPGFLAAEGWNPAVGLGVPRVEELVRAARSSNDLV